MVEKVMINPAFLQAYYSLESTQKNFKTVHAKYGAGDSAYEAALARRKSAESLFTSRKGLIKADGDTGMSLDSAKGILNGYFNKVSSWYA